MVFGLETGFLIYLFLSFYSMDNCITMRSFNSWKDSFRHFLSV